MRHVAPLLLVGLLLPGAHRAGAAPAQQAPPTGTIAFACAGCPGSVGGSSIFTISARGGAARVVVGARADNRFYHPAWSPTRPVLVFTRSFDEIWRSNADGKSRRRLTPASPLSGNDHATWSPDGRRIAFVRSGAGRLRAQVLVMNADGSAPRRLWRSRNCCANLSWSPDGGRLAFSSRDRLYVLDLRARRARRVGASDLVGRHPRWSPDGRRLSFVRQSGGIALAVLDLASGRVRDVMPLTRHWISAPHDWSPDGRWLAVGRVLEVGAGPKEQYPFELWLMRPDGGERRLLYSAGYGEPYGLDWGSYDGVTR